MKSKRFSVGYTAIFLIIITMPFMFCSCDIFDGYFSKEVTSISLSESDITLTVGDSRMIEVKFEPDDADNKEIVWISSNEDIVSVKGGTVTAKRAGSAVISAEIENGIKKECNVTVKEQEITKITLSDETATLKEGQTIQIEAKVTPSDAKDDNLVWSSDSEDIAKVNSSGYVTGVTAGVANIVCKAPNGVEASCNVTVRAAVQATASTKSTEPSSTEQQDETKSATSKSESKNSNSSDSKYSGCIFPDSSSRRLTVNEVSKLSASEAQQAINEIFARNGNIFKTQSIQQYFEAQSWYEPKGKVNTGDLSDVEQYNISLLQNYR